MTATGDRSVRRRWVIGLATSIGTGALVSIQSLANGTLSARIEDPLLTSLTAFVVAIIVTSLVIGSRASSREALKSFIPALRTGQLPWVVLSAGAFGCLFSISQAFSVAVIGVAVFTVVVIAGQNIGGLLVDRLGVGVVQEYLTPSRVLGAGLSLIAIVVAVGPSLTGLNGAWLYIVAVAIGGFSVSIQLALSGRTATAVRDPFVAGFVVFTVGIVVLAIAVILHSTWTTWHVSELASTVSANPLLLIGGVCGAGMMAGASIAVPRVGVLVFTLAVVIGQLVLAILIDVVTGQIDYIPVLVMASVLTVISVAVAVLPGFLRSARS